MTEGCGGGREREIMSRLKKLELSWVAVLFQECKLLALCSKYPEYTPSLPLPFLWDDVHSQASPRIVQAWASERASEWASDQIRGSLSVAGGFYHDHASFKQRLFSPFEIQMQAFCLFLSTPCLLLRLNCSHGNRLLFKGNILSFYLIHCSRRELKY